MLHCLIQVMSLPLVEKMELYVYGKVIMIHVDLSVICFILLDTECVQTIRLPCVSVWSVYWSSNGDIVVGSRLEVHL